MALSRRQFLTRTCASAVGMISVSSVLHGLARSETPPSVNVKTLLIDFERTGELFTVRADFCGQTHEYKLTEDRNEIVSKLEDLYLDLQLSFYEKSEIIARAKWLGDRILSPISREIDSCDEIQFIIPENFIRLPFDFLQYRKQSLFLQRPVKYSFAPVDSIFEFSKYLSALIVSDRTADPDRGVYFLKDRLSNSIYYDIQDLTLQNLSSLSPKDIVLISAHGLISFNSEDYIALNEESIKAGHLARLSPKLIYLDSCQLGVSNEFIQNLRRAKTRYYIAPILSNEAGNSSTKTIEFFFKSLQQGLSPSQALFKTRIQLYKHFKMRNNYRMLIWRAFPFRVYHLN